MVVLGVMFRGVEGPKAAMEEGLKRAEECSRQASITCLNESVFTL
jgi:hypothetical protein